MGLFSKKISTRDIVPVCRQLATSYDAGIPILRGLEMVAEGARPGPARDVLIAMRGQVLQGSTLGEAARAQKAVLPEFFVELLAAGEIGGRLDVMLRDLASYFEDRAAMNRQILGAMVYPFFQLLLAWIIGTFAIMLIGRVNLNASTAFNFAAFLNAYMLLQAKALAVVGVAFVVAVVLSRYGLFGYVWGWVATYVWPMRNVTRKFALARFFRSLSLLIGSGLDIMNCIRGAASVTANPYMQKDLLQALPHIAQGATLVQAFAGAQTLTPVAREMIFIGEQSGNLEETLRKVAEYHLDEANHAVKIAVKVMNTVIGLAIGGVVGYVVITFYSKYLGLIDSVLN